MTRSSAQDFLSRLVREAVTIERHERVAVALSFAYFFCVLSSYYTLRPVRESMAVVSGPQTIPFLFMGTFFAMLVATTIFGWIASRYPRRKFLPWVYLFFVANILIFWVAFSIAVREGGEHVWLSRVFFVWLSVFNLFVVSVFWSFMADIYTREQGRRLFGFIAAGGSIGALLGGIATSWLVVPIGFENLMPIAAGLLLIAVACIAGLRRWVASTHEDDLAGTAAGDTVLGGKAIAGITHVLFSSPYFSAIALSSIIASLLGTALYMFMAELVNEAIPGTDEQTRYFSNVNNWINGLALLAQMFIVKQIVGRFGIGVSLSLMPLVSVAGFILLALEPTLLVVAVFTVVRRGIGFGFSKPTTDMLYSVVTPEDKYKTKNFIDTAVYRFGDLFGTWTIRGIQTLGFGLSAISIVMVPFAALWAMVSLWLGRDYRRRAKELRKGGVQ